MSQSTPHARDIAGESWDPAQYLKFSDHRLRPALDLLARVPLADPRRVYDLGCGSGHVTRMLADRWPRATGMRPILAGLGDTDRTTFLDQYRQRLRHAYPRRADGITLYPFHRLFFVAVRR